MGEKKDTFQLENAFKELETIISQLESDSVPLRESLALYGKGAKLLLECKEELSGIEKEMIIIGENMEQEEEESYEF